MEAANETISPCCLGVDLCHERRRGAGDVRNEGGPKCTKDACEPKAIDKNGKPLAGAAKASFMKKCESEA
jgi:hypothetical protein